MIKEIDLIDHQNLLDSFYQIEKNIVWTNFGSGRQTGLQFKGNEDHWVSAVGKTKDYDSRYDNLNPYFKGTLFEEIILKYQLKRTRFLWMNGKSCYSMHKDNTPRLHIPIITNPQCFMIFQIGTIQHLKSGSVYWVDTRKSHTAMNGSDLERLHLVGAVEI